MTETQLKRKVQEYIKSIGGFSIKISDRFTIGIPDMWVIVNGRSMWIELKTSVGVVSGIQQFFINQINKHGGEAYVARSVEEVKKIIESKTTQSR